jgi:hypothetical protein
VNRNEIGSLDAILSPSHTAVVEPAAHIELACRLSCTKCCCLMPLHQGADSSRLFPIVKSNLVLALFPGECAFIIDAIIPAAEAICRFIVILRSFHLFLIVREVFFFNCVECIPILKNTFVHPLCVFHGREELKEVESFNRDARAERCVRLIAAHATV